jgi:hypothetical protein
MKPDRFGCRNRGVPGVDRFHGFLQTFDMVITAGGNAALCSAGLYLSMPYRKFVHGLYHVLALVKCARE